MSIYFTTTQVLTHVVFAGVVISNAFVNDTTIPRVGTGGGARTLIKHPVCRKAFLRTTAVILIFANYITNINFAHLFLDRNEDRYEKEVFWLPVNNVNVNKRSDHDASLQNDAPYSDFIRHRYCKGKSPCIALLSASHHQGIGSEIDQRSLKQKTVSHQDQTNIKNRILVRDGYCAIHGCDVIVDFNDYHKNRSMWLSDFGKHKVGQMPPHWNKVAALQRWLPHYDGILQMDMDSTWVLFNESVYDLFDDTSTVYTVGSPELLLFKKGDMSHCIVDSWWYYGTSPGCRYVKYPQNHRFQTQNLDMPWFWYSMMHCAEVYGAGPFECLNTCNGPKTYVDHLMKDPNHKVLQYLWISDCWETKWKEVENYTQAVISKTWHNKYLNLNMNWGNTMNFSESFKNSISVHYKDSTNMVAWLNKTAQILLNSGCTEESCLRANVTLIRESLL